MTESGVNQLYKKNVQGHMTEHVRTVHEGKKRIYKEVNCQVRAAHRAVKLLLIGSYNIVATLIIHILDSYELCQ
jgi:hypothetical protein